MTGGGVHLSTLLHRAGVLAASASGGDPLVSGVTLDSRRAGGGHLFFALRGERHDGLDHVGDAIARGAVAVVSDRPRPAGLGVAWVTVDEPRDAVGPVAREVHGRPDESMVLVGITGTNGKTTVAWMTEAMIRAAGREAGRLGTIGYAWAGRDVPAARTTPEAPELYALLAAMRDAGIDYVAMEVSSHALALGRVGGARFAVAAFLNLGRDHLDFHGDLESYFRAKATLFESLDPTATAVLPAGDPRGAELGARTRASVLTYGRERDADVRIVDETRTAAGSTARLATPRGEVDVRVALPGDFNVTNAAAAAGCLIATGLPVAAIAGGLRDLERVPGRMEPVDCGQPFAVVVDYAHTPDALQHALRAARDLGGRLTVVFGCGGDRDRGKRGAMGAIAARLADSIVLTSDNPRGEDPDAILREIRQGAASVPGGEERTRTIPDREEAIRSALEGAGSGDVVLVAGKGHETTQAAGDDVRELDDRRVARDALRDLGWERGRHADA